MPLRAVEGRDGRSWVLNDAKGPALRPISAMLADFQAREVDLPVDFDHQMDKPDPGRTGPVPAAGRIKSLKVMTDGIWGQVVWPLTVLLAARPN